MTESGSEEGLLVRAKPLVHDQATFSAMDRCS
jgi:hypothetical protein